MGDEGSAFQNKSFHLHAAQSPSLNEPMVSGLSIVTGPEVAELYYEGGPGGDRHKGEMRRGGRSEREAARLYPSSQEWLHLRHQ